MKRLFTLSLITLSLVGCGDSRPPSSNLAAQTIDLGTATTKAAQDNFSGNWQVVSKSPWISLSKETGTGDLSFVITANKDISLPASADVPKLDGYITISWRPIGSTVSSITNWTVTADQYVLKGKLGGASVQSIQSIPTKAVSSTPSTVAKGIIVAYKTGAAKESAFHISSIQSGAASSAQRLNSLGIQQSLLKPMAANSIFIDLAATPELINKIKSDPNVAYVSRNMKMTTQAISTPVIAKDQFANLQWAYPLLGYGAVWRDMESGGYTKPVTVAVIDSGVRYDHPDLAGKLYLPTEGALDVVPDGVYNNDGDGFDSNPTDPFADGRSGSHGTHVSGIIAANWGNFTPTCSGCSSSGVVGASYLAPIKILPIRAIGTNGSTESQEIIDSVRYAAGLPVTLSKIYNGKNVTQTLTNPHPAKVINLSLGGSMPADDAKAICDAMTEASKAGALIFAAAGNGYGTQPYYPAACSSVVAVGSVTLSESHTPVHASYSNSYPEVQLSAPGGTDLGTTYNGGILNGQAFGDYILSTDWDYTKNEPSYGAISGTSQATPQASALAALMLSKGITTGSSDTLARMISTATDLGTQGRDNDYGYGMINAAAALNAPAVSANLGIRIDAVGGESYRPKLDALNNFTAYLGEGTYKITGGIDTNGSGIVGEFGEAKATATATLSQSTPIVNIGTLVPK